MPLNTCLDLVFIDNFVWLSNWVYQTHLLVCYFESLTAYIPEYCAYIHTHKWSGFCHVIFNRRRVCMSVHIFLLFVHIYFPGRLISMDH